MRRVAVLGCGGSGKTTLAHELGRRLGLEVFHADVLRYDAAGAPRLDADWRALHDAVLRRESWVFDAMKPALLPRRLAAADTAVFLDVPRHVCLFGIVRRRLRHGRHPVLQLGVAPRIDMPLLRWVWRFRAVQRPVVLACLACHAGTTHTIILRRRGEVWAFLASLPEPDDACVESTQGRRSARLVFPRGLRSAR